MVPNIILITIVAILVIMASYIEWRHNSRMIRFSIKDTMSLTNLPIATFHDGDIELNFILDSGSTQSHISKDAASMLAGTPIATDYTYVTSTGYDTTSEMIDSTIEYKGRAFNVELLVNESLDCAFTQIKEECNVQLHGILGSDFLIKYGFNIDFNELSVQCNKA